MKKQKEVILSLWDKQVLVKNMSARFIILFTRLENEAMELDVYDYYDKYYSDLRRLIFLMERSFPNVDTSKRN